MYLQEGTLSIEFIQCYVFSSWIDNRYLTIYLEQKTTLGGFCSQKFVTMRDDSTFVEAYRFLEDFGWSLIFGYYFCVENDI